jgi:predicted metal-dependent HD superfamily phosphohydrolase
MLDFDLSILGQDWEIYEAYIQNIRKEYKLYPDFLYNPSRRKILENFLKRKSLFFTEKYQDILEDKARVNLIREIKLLS